MENLTKKRLLHFFATTTKHGAITGKVQEHQVTFYNLDMIISVGYRVHSYRKVLEIYAISIDYEYVIITR